jgi:hypothetical protein
MKTVYCVLCQKKKSDNNWFFKKWDDGVEGWACSLHFKPKGYPNLTDKRLKPQREEFAKDLIQPFRGGEPSKEFADEYPEQAKKIFKNEKKKPRKVWS